MRNIHVALMENILSPVLVNECVPWEDFAIDITDPDNRVVTQDKDTVRQFNTIKFKKIEECESDDVREWWLNKTKPVPKGEEQVIDFTHYNARADYPSRSTNNTIGFDAIILDIDENITWNKALSKLSKYEYAAYTTHSNMIRKKGVVCERFRVIIPTTRLVTLDEWENKKDSISALFPFIDPASISISQPFYLPSCPQSLLAYADSAVNKGMFIDFDKLEVNKPKEVINTHHQNDDIYTMTPEERTKTFYGLCSSPISRNYMGVLAEAMRKCGYSYSEFLTVWKSCRSNPDEKKAEGQWKQSMKYNNASSNKFWLKKAARGEKCV